MEILFLTYGKIKIEYNQDVAHQHKVNLQQFDNLEATLSFIKQNHPKSDYYVFYNSDTLVINAIDSILNTIISYKNIEVLHGNSSKSSDFLNVYRFQNPIWLYNLDPDVGIDHTNWRIGFDLLVLKQSVVTQYIAKITEYENSHSSALDWGYLLHQSGVIVRYSARLNQLYSNAVSYSASIHDQFLFAKRHLSSKWFYWSTLRYLSTYGKLTAVLSVLRRLKAIGKVAYVEHARKMPEIRKDLSNCKVSVFTPTLYRYSYLEQELIQLSNQTIKPHQIIITDQTKHDDINVEFLSKYNDLNILYTHQSENGQCVAWNYCIEHATGDYLLFLGDDADDITTEFIEQLLTTLVRFDADVVACNIKERDADYPYKQKEVFVTDTFPICLVKRSMFFKTGGYDFAYNKGIRADGDVAIRMYLNGALMILNPQIKIYHHRAPVGGLRSHKQRKVSNKDARSSITKFQFPAFTEYYLLSRYYPERDRKELLLLKYISVFQTSRGFVFTILKVLYGIIISPILIYRVKQTIKQADRLFENHPKIPVLNHADT